MRIIIIGLIILFNFILQTTLFKSIEIRGIHPNTMIAIIACYAVLRGSIEGAIVGLFSGLLTDLFYGTSLGYNALIGLCVGYFCGAPADNFYRNNFYIPLVFCCLSTFFAGVFVYVVSFMMRGNLRFVDYLSRVILPEAVYTLVVSFVIYRILYAINETLEKKENTKRKIF